MEPSELEQLRQKAQSMFEYTDNIITPLHGISYEERESFGKDLKANPAVEQIGMIAFTDTVNYSQKDDVQLTIPFYRDQPHSILSNKPDLPHALSSGALNVFIGPLMSNDTYHPSGYGVWQFTDKTASEEK